MNFKEVLVDWVCIALIEPRMEKQNGSIGTSLVA